MERFAGKWEKWNLKSDLRKCWDSDLANQQCAAAGEANLDEGRKRLLLWKPPELMVYSYNPIPCGKKRCSELCQLLQDEMSCSRGWQPKELAQGCHGSGASYTDIFEQIQFLNKSLPQYYRLFKWIWWHLKIKTALLLQGLCLEEPRPDCVLLLGFAST